VTGDRRDVVVRVLTWVNTAMLVVLVALAAFPRGAALQLGLWRDCEITPPATSGTSGWSWPVLLAAIPLVTGLLVALWSRGVFQGERREDAPPHSAALLAVSIAGLAVLGLMWLVPIARCVT
jgi:hypothetical protein